jgi:hypothetical protein
VVDISLGPKGSCCLNLLCILSSPKMKKVKSEFTPQSLENTKYLGNQFKKKCIIPRR